MYYNSAAELHIEWRTYTGAMVHSRASVEQNPRDFNGVVPRRPIKRRAAVLAIENGKA